jgi:TolA-binding protein
MPHYVNVDFNLASCFYKKGDWEKAIHHAKISHKRFPDYLAGMMLLAYAHYQMGQHQKAVAICDQVLKRYKGHHAALSLRKKIKSF